MDINNFLINKFFYILFFIIQILLSFVPMTLKSWEDDLINILTFIGYQTFIFGILFLLGVKIVKVPELELSTGFCCLNILVLFSIYKTFKKIPLEFSGLFLKKIDPAQEPDFEEFNTKSRSYSFEKIDFSSPYGEAEFKLVCERLKRKKLEKDTSILEQMIDEQGP